MGLPNQPGISSVLEFKGDDGTEIELVSASDGLVLGYKTIGAEGKVSWNVEPGKSYAYNVTKNRPLLFGRSGNVIAPPAGQVMTIDVGLMVLLNWVAITGGVAAGIGILWFMLRGERIDL